VKATLRPAKPGDVPAISNIEKTAFPCPWPERALYGEIENDLATFKVLSLEGKVIGYYDLWICADEAHLLNVAVVPPERRRGHGTLMIEDAIDEAKRRGCRRIVLEVRPGNCAAISLYGKFGFKTVTRRPRYYANGDDADVMLKDLKATPNTPKGAR
jgi:ribosomal-protein-alanine N-acetyltransferase